MKDQNFEDYAQAHMRWMNKKKIVSKFFYLPTTINGKRYWLCRKLVVQKRVTVIYLIMEDTIWCDLRIATTEDLINYL
jgi:hypothetical protein